MNSAIRSLQREAVKPLQHAVKEQASKGRAPVSDARIAYEIKSMTSNLSAGSSETRRNTRNASTVTYKVLKKLQAHNDSGDEVSGKALAAAMYVLLCHGLPKAIPRLLTHAQKVMKIQNSIVLYSLTAAAHASAGNPRLMWHVIETEIPAHNLKPTVYTYNLCIGQLGRRGLKSDAFKVLQAMLAAGVGPDALTWSRLITSCDTVKQASDTLDALRHSLQPTYVHYNAVLSVCLKNNDATQAEYFFHTMLHSTFKDCKPNTTTYTTLMSVYKQLGQFTRVVEVYNRMKKYSVTPNAATYVVFVGACDMMAQRGRETQKYVSVGITAFKQALAEGLDDANVITTAGHFLNTHSTADVMRELKVHMEVLEIDVSRRYLDLLAEKEAAETGTRRAGARATEALRSTSTPQAVSHV